LLQFIVNFTYRGEVVEGIEWILEMAFAAVLESLTEGGGEVSFLPLVVKQSPANIYLNIDY
jgi:hypothetical protein